MSNPWLNIPAADYENHMSHKDIGQLQALNLLTKQFLDKHKPQSFVLLGCTTGNGLEHIDTGITKQLHAIDINPNYLKITAERYAGIPNLKTHLIDINTDDLPFRDIDLFLLPLVLEYVDIGTALQKVIDSLSPNGVIAIVIQKSEQSNFVSPTKQSSLNELSSIATIIDSQKLIDFLAKAHFLVIEQKEIKLTEQKSFITLEFKFKPKN